MRFIKIYPKHGDYRIKKFFAWLPVTIGLETRWLEKVTIRQQYFSLHANRTIDHFSGWMKCNFIDN